MILTIWTGLLLYFGKYFGGKHELAQWDIATFAGMKALKPEPPVQGMGFISQKVAGKSNVAANLPPVHHPYLRQRTYPKEYRVETCNGCFPYVYRTMIDVVGCGPMDSPLLIGLATTTPREKEQRQAIRESWGKKTTRFRLIFLFGVGWTHREQEILYAESILHGDILQENYIDSYFNLSLKVLSGFRWSSRKCPKVPYVLRTAIDNYNNIDGMIKRLASQPVWPVGIMGYCFVDGMGTIRDRNNKWYVHPKEFNASGYPPYCIGTSFLLSAETVRAILNTAPNVPHFVMEDVYFGMVLKVALKSKSTVQVWPGINIGPPPVGGACYLPLDWLSLHGVGSAAHTKWLEKNCTTNPRPTPMPPTRKSTFGPTRNSLGLTLRPTTRKLALAAGVKQGKKPNIN